MYTYTIPTRRQSVRDETKQHQQHKHRKHHHRRHHQQQRSNNPASEQIQSDQVMCSRPRSDDAANLGRITGLARPSDVCLSVCPYVPHGLLTQKESRKTKMFLRTGVTFVPIFNSKCLRSRGRPHNVSALGRHIFSYADIAERISGYWIPLRGLSVYFCLSVCRPLSVAHCQPASCRRQHLACLED